jgi:glucan phosphoethanolaminetransferase (alkaline phosphatase superfamily)
MIQFKKKFLQRLEVLLEQHPEKRNIVDEYEDHLNELISELSLKKDFSKQEQEIILERLGTPEEIAEAWNQEMTVTPQKTQWTFLLTNLCFFAAGSFLTFTYHQYQWKWLQSMWTSITSLPSLIMALYLLFWGLLGYEIGKEFGHTGKGLLKRTFVLAIVPNLLLMYLIIFEIIPHTWFNPLLNPPFIVICIVFTVLLYPICWIGFRWGKRVSIQ